MQKLINVLAVSSFVVSAGVVVGGTYLYLEKDNIVESAKERVTTEIGKIIKDSLGGSLTPDLPQLGGTSGGNVPTPELPGLPF